MEYYIHNIPLFVVDKISPEIDLPSFCEEVEELIPQDLLSPLDVVYIGKFKELAGRNATYADGAIYITSEEPTNHDMLEDFIHEVAHALDKVHGMKIYTDDLIQEFKGKRKRLYHILKAEGYDVSEGLFNFTEYNQKFDMFLSDEVGYPSLVPLTMGLFVSPYGATSIQEYFANGFEKYFLENPRTVRMISPILYRKIEEIINDDEA